MTEPTTTPEGAAPAVPDRRLSLRYTVPIGLALAVIVVYAGLRIGGVGITRNPRESAELRGKGHRLLKEGDVEGAIAAFRSAIAADARDVEAHRGYQNAMRKGGREAELIPEYEQRAKLNPRDPDAMYLLARLRKTNEEVLAGMLATLQISPHYGPAHRAIAVMARENKDLETAAKHMEFCTRSAWATPDDVRLMITLAHELNDVTHIQQWLRRWWEVVKGADGSTLHPIYLARDGGVNSITLWLNERAQPKQYLLMVARDGVGTRWIGVSGRDGEWAVKESGDWSTMQGVPDPNVLMRDAVPTQTAEPDYPLLFGRAQRYLREERK